MTPDISCNQIISNVFCCKCGLGIGYFNMFEKVTLERDFVEWDEKEKMCMECYNAI